jgi:hypothetical protein
VSKNSFNFSSKVTEFTKQLGALCPDKYDYKIRKGDTLDISKGLLSFNIESPVVKKVLAPKGRIIVFPNSHIHRVTKMSSKNGADAVRRILVFWLVNPESPIVSSANVKPQQDQISFGVAKKHRLALMKERKVHKEDFSEREVFLCEH